MNLTWIWGPYPSTDGEIVTAEVKRKIAQFAFIFTSTECISFICNCTSFWKKPIVILILTGGHAKPEVSHCTGTNPQTAKRCWIRMTTRKLVARFSSNPGVNQPYDGLNSWRHDVKLGSWCHCSYDDITIWTYLRVYKGQVWFLLSVFISLR